MNETNTAPTAENPYLGSSFDNLLREDGIRNEVNRAALERVREFERTRRKRRKKTE